MDRIQDLRKQIDLMSDQLSRKDDQIHSLMKLHRNRLFIFRV